MKTFFLILFFGKFILLTPEPVSLSEEWVYIEPEKPISAITGGATIHIDVSQYINDKWSDAEYHEKFLSGTIHGKLLAADGTTIEMVNKFRSYNKESVHLMMDAGKPIPTNIEFTRVALKSSRKIKDVSVYWKNNKM